MSNIYSKLLAIQAELKAPKGQYNSFGKYKYRSCEDILEAVKPLCKKQGVALMLDDEIIFISGRFYVKAAARLVDVDSGEAVVVNANAREDEIKKGMDGSQITGSASSYARKYALNGLFDIDDTKDADTDEQRNQTKANARKAAAKQETQNSGKVTCPQCGNVLTGYISKSGAEITPEQELEKLGMCKECFRKVSEK